MKTLKVFLFTMLVASACFAQKESITIGPGDMIHVKVLEAPELEQSARVTDAGTFPLIVGGSVQVAGLTPSEAARAIDHALQSGNFLLTPHASVVLEQSVNLNVTVLGAVKSPGFYPIGTPRSILEVLALAGGLDGIASNSITIERRDTKEKVRYTLSNQPDMSLDQSVLVYPGDKVFVPKADVVYVLGSVGRAGGYSMTTNDSKLSVLQAIARAGGTTPTAVPSKARLIRKKPDGTYVEMHIQLSEMQKGEISDLQLQDNDILYVPFSYLRGMLINVDSIIAAAGSASIYHF